MQPHIDYTFIRVETQANTFISSMISGQVECQGHLPKRQVASFGLVFFYTKFHVNDRLRFNYIGFVQCHISVF